MFCCKLDAEVPFKPELCKIPQQCVCVWCCKIMLWGHKLLLSNGSLTHWGRATHICLGKLTTIGSDNGLSPGRRLAIIWTIAGILLIGPLGTNFSENLIQILTFSFKKMHLKMSSAKWRPFCLSLNVLIIKGDKDPFRPGDECIKWWTGSSLDQIMACCLSSAKPLPDPMLVCFQSNPYRQISMRSKHKHLHTRI